MPMKKKKLMTRLAIGLARSVLVAGILLSFAQPISANLIANGGFETGDFTGWTLTGNVTPSTRVTTASDDPTVIHVHSGIYGVVSGPHPPDVYLSQSLATTVGQTYIVDFWLAASGGPPNHFSVNWNGTSLSSMVDSPSFSFTEFNFAVTGTGSDTLQFDMNNTGLAWGLDDVSVTPTPTPEPGSLVLVALGLAGLGWSRRRQR